MLAPGGSDQGGGAESEGLRLGSAPSQLEKGTLIPAVPTSQGCCEDWGGRRGGEHSECVAWCSDVRCFHRSISSLEFHSLHSFNNKKGKSTFKLYGGAFSWYKFVFGKYLLSVFSSVLQQLSNCELPWTRCLGVRPSCRGEEDLLWTWRRTFCEPEGCSRVSDFAIQKWWLFYTCAC